MSAISYHTTLPISSYYSFESKRLKNKIREDKVELMQQIKKSPPPTDPIPQSLQSACLIAVTCPIAEGKEGQRKSVDATAQGDRTEDGKLIKGERAAIYLEGIKPDGTKIGAERLRLPDDRKVLIALNKEGKPLVFVHTHNVEKTSTPVFERATVSSRMNGQNSYTATLKDGSRYCIELSIQGENHIRVKGDIKRE